MDIIQEKQFVIDLIKKCIGSRTLDEVSALTGLSRNRLHRLRAGDFVKMPSEDVIRALTAEDAEPQNGVTYSDFSAVINHEQHTEVKNKLSVKRSTVSKTRVDCIVLKWLLTFGDVTIYKKGTKESAFDLVASTDNQKYYFEYKLVLSKPISQSYLERISMELITRIATCTIEKDGIYVIVTNSEQLSKTMKSIKLNVASKVILIQVNIEDDQVIAVENIN